MTNAELNLAIAKLVYPDASISMQKGSETAVFVHRYSNADGLWVRVFDYCNNWNDLIPLVVGHCIELQYWNRGHEQGWFACYWDREGYPRETELISNPQRTLAECLLKVLQEKSQFNNSTEYQPSVDKQEKADE